MDRHILGYTYASRQDYEFICLLRMSKGTLENNLRWRRISSKSLLTYIIYVIHISFLLVHYVTEFMYCKVVIYVLSRYGLVFTVTNQSLKIDRVRGECCRLQYRHRQNASKDSHLTMGVGADIAKNL